MNQPPKDKCLEATIVFHVTDEVGDIKISRTFNLIWSGYFYLLFLISLPCFIASPGWDKIVFCLGHGLLAVCFMIKYLRNNQALREFGDKRPIFIERSKLAHHEITQTSSTKGGD